MRAADSFFTFSTDDFLFFFWAGSSPFSAAVEVLGTLESASSRSDEPERKQRFFEATGGSTEMILLKSPEVDGPGRVTRRSTTVEVPESRLVLESSNERFLGARF